jgi:hypothetical protein
MAWSSPPSNGWDGFELAWTSVFLFPRLVLQDGAIPMFGSPIPTRCSTHYPQLPPRPHPDSFMILASRAWILYCYVSDAAKTEHSILRHQFWYLSHSYLYSVLPNNCNRVLVLRYLFMMLVLELIVHVNSKWSCEAMVTSICHLAFEWVFDLHTIEIKLVSFLSVSTLVVVFFRDYEVVQIRATWESRSGSRCAPFSFHHEDIPHTSISSVYAYRIPLCRHRAGLGIFEFHLIFRFVLRGWVKLVSNLTFCGKLIKLQITL